MYHDDTVHSYKDLLPASDPDYRGMKNPLAVSAVTKKLCDQVYEHAKDGRCVLTLGGDHSIAIGTIAGTAKAIRERLGREMAVIWVDAHTDINTPETSESGNVHGMPVAFLSGLAKDDREDIFGWLKKENLISLKKLVYIGLRDVDRGEKLILREHGIKAFSMHDIDRYVLHLSCGPYADQMMLDTVSAESWKWLLVISATIHLSTSPSTSMRWIQCGLLALERLFEEALR